MSSIQPHEAQTRIYREEPERRPPPLLEVGVLAWIRTNLFSSWTDTILTILGILIIISTIISFVTWAVKDANWFSIMLNLRQLSVGRLPLVPEIDIRILLVVIFIALTVGVSLAAFARKIGASLVAGIVAVLVALLIIPPAIEASIPLPETYLTAGNIDIVSGSQTEQAQEQVAFIGRAGDVITFRLANELAADDSALSGINGFTDVATNALRNAATRRLETLDRIAELDELLQNIEAGGRIPYTDRQIAAFVEEREKLEAPPVVTDNYTINQVTVEVSLINGATGELVGEPQRLVAGSDETVSFNLEEDGWYILDKRIVEGEGVAVLGTVGVYPIFQRDSRKIDEAVEAAAESGLRPQEWVRVNDQFVLQEVDDPLPRDDSGNTVEFLDIVDNQYRGDRDFQTYLRIYLAPFLNENQVLSDVPIINSLGRVNIFFLFIFILAAVGYIGANMLDSRLSPSNKPKLMSRKAATYMLVLTPILMFILVRGLPFGTVLHLSLFGSGFALAYAINHFSGIALNTFGRDYDGQKRALYSLGMAIIAFVVMLLAPLVFAGAMGLEYSTGTLDIIMAAIFAFIGFFAALNGFNRPVSEADLAQARKQFRSAFVITLALYLLPPILVATGILYQDGVIPDGPLPLTDARRWSGLLLTMMLTIFPIIGAFPLGILLALGRRSNLPAVKYFCTGYIELVRGVPLITVLFMVQLLIPLITPALSEFEAAFRAMIAIMLFSAAYLAENVRGGLQSIPPGQEEAARALGLSEAQTIRFILLPQALRAVIPALVGQFISLFKDTSLVAIVGLIDLTGFANNVLPVQTAFIGSRREGLLFISVIYFVFSYVMSYVSRRIEESGAGAARRV